MKNLAVLLVTLMIMLNPTAIEAYEAATLAVNLAGEAHIMIPDPLIAVDQSINVTIELQFSADRRRVRIINFPPITTREYETPRGTSTTTVTLKSGGTGTFN